MRKSLLALLLLASCGLAQAEVQLKDGHPQSYTVVKGDTLWDISGKFLSEPWKWPEIWQANPQIENPHWIYPGDLLSLVYVDGQPRLMLNRGNSHGTVKLSPEVRSKPMAEAIPTIPLEAINSFLLNNRIVESQADFDNAPYIVGGQGGSVLYGAGQEAFARGNFADQDPAYGVFRQGKTYTNPNSGEFLGINANSVGAVDKRAIDGDIATMLVTRSSEELRRGDRLFVSEERAVNSTFVPSAPKEVVSGIILDVPRGVTTVGAMDVVTLDRGKRDGLVEGSVLAIYKTGETVRDIETEQSLQMPAQRAGLVMVFRVYEKLSYALVLQADRALSVLDQVRNP